MDMVMGLGFPWWLRVEHFLNIIFISFLIRSGIEILGTYPKLYRSQHSVAGTAWAQFTIQEAPKHKYYTVGGEYDDYSPRLSLPGRGLLGVGRYWHFITVTGFVACWVIYFVLLFSTGQWRRYVPTSLDTFADAGHDFLAYLAFTVPHAVEGMPFNAIQQLSYGFVILILTPLVIITGAFQSPAIANYFSRITRAVGGSQVIRTVHFLCLVGYVVFTVIHVVMVVLHGYGHETAKMVFGNYHLHRRPRRRAAAARGGHALDAKRRPRRRKAAQRDRATVVEPALPPAVTYAVRPLKHHRKRSGAAERYPKLSGERAATGDEGILGAHG